jgi:hypothetical protein
MSSVVKITDQFPESRSRTVLLELLRVVTEFQQNGISVIVCGGWVPLLKELARKSSTKHSMSLDIDLIVSEAARDEQNIDKIRSLLDGPLQYSISRDATFRFEKKVDGDLVELELLVDLKRPQEDDPIRKFPGIKTSLDLCTVDGSETLNKHLETISITAETALGTTQYEIRIPDAVGFLILKTSVTKYREENKDPYDIYYYCRYSEDSSRIRQLLSEAAHELEVRAAIVSLKLMFTYPDSKWVEMILDHLQFRDEARDREALLIVKTFERLLQGF